MTVDFSIENIKIILLTLMILVTLATFYLTARLRILIKPIVRRLTDMHKNNILSYHDPGNRIEKIKKNYKDLIKIVDNVDTAEFSAGEIETLSFQILKCEITAASAHNWIIQAPSILISLGLLGTFWGLTIGLSQISGVLTPGATPQETMNALLAIVTPMSTAFETSLVGLIFSLVVLIVTQLSGTKTSLERCEALLSSWLETILPKQLNQEKQMVPLKKAIESLNKTCEGLHEKISNAVKESMQEAFEAKLGDIFNANANIAEEAQQATRQLSAIASNLNECGQDFLMAANAFRQSNFPEALRESVTGLLEAKEAIIVSSNVLTERLQEVRDGLVATQGQWKILAKTAETELRSCRTATEQLKLGIDTVQETSKTIGEGIEITAVASKQLRETRLEVMRDRKLSIDVAEAVKDRLAVDTSSVETCLTFSKALEVALSKWNNNVNQLDKLREAFINSSITGRENDEHTLQKLKADTEELINTLQTSLERDLATAISTKAADLERLGEPLTKAQELSNEMLNQLLDIQTRLNSASKENRRQGFWGQGGNS